MPRYRNSMMINPQVQEALEGVREAVQGEREDELFYDYLISVAPTREDKEIIESIRDDECRHNRLFRSIYKEFRGMEVSTAGEEIFERPKSYIDGIKKALFGELRAVEKYMGIRRDLPMGPYKDMLFDIITDKIKHSVKYNYLFNLNSSKNLVAMNRSPVQDTSKFTPDDWVRYITPLVNRALLEAKAGINPEHLYQEFILSGVLVGLGKTPQEAIEQVEQWETTGESQLLAKSKMGRSYY
ncbi:ferritin-like domain-containing protein [Clostridium brassicae]|uniref:Ferritin-like domain-containing protein n=1 Tax=Clostridium brassicae TaxID=2999072 RepID=A0ABT4DGK1_9CLOT|nr:ferritin-like domain-containing protein [Clostridium brassicae]MCY6960241.1 ferritin-like domain-containing protein [Clostridium brassicae]